MHAPSQDWLLVWAAVAAVAATVTALVTIAYAYFTLRLVRAQAEPKVIVYVKHDLERPSMLMIVIENIGHDIAHDVTFRPSRSIPERAYGITQGDAGEAQPMREGPLVTGIPSLGPGDSRVITWGQYGGLSKALGSVPIVLDYTYRHERRTIQGQAKLEVLSYAATDASEKPMVTMAKALTDLSRTMSRISSHIETLVKRETSDTGGSGGDVA